MKKYIFAFAIVLSGCVSGPYEPPPPAPISDYELFDCTHPDGFEQPHRMEGVVCPPEFGGGDLAH